MLGVELACFVASLLATFFAHWGNARRGRELGPADIAKDPIFQFAARLGYPIALVAACVGASLHVARLYLAGTP